MRKPKFGGMKFGGKKIAPPKPKISQPPALPKAGAEMGVGRPFGMAPAPKPIKKIGF